MRAVTTPRDHLPGQTFIWTFSNRPTSPVPARSENKYVGGKCFSSVKILTRNDVVGGFSSYFLVPEAAAAAAAAKKKTG